MLIKNGLKISKVYKLFNYLFRYCYPLYHYCYYSYKCVTEKSKISMLQTKIKEGMVVVDVGANIGFFTKIFSGAVGKSGQVHSFEPEKLNFIRLQNNVKKLSNVFISQMAISDINGEQDLYKSLDLNVDHKLYSDQDDLRCMKEKIKSITLDSYFKSINRLPIVDFLKMDIQGFEPRAIKGMKSVLDSSPNLKILSEFYPYGISKSGCIPADYLSFIRQSGFKLVFLDEGIDELACESHKENPDFYTDFLAYRY